MVPMNATSRIGANAPAIGNKNPVMVASPAPVRNSFLSS
jgi:hypothetical protein